jgi:hypothetical protein
VRQVIRSNSYLSVPAGSARAVTIDAARGYVVTLSGRSPVTGETEQVRAYTRALPDGHVIYVLFVAPQSEAALLDPTFDRMLRTLVVNDAAYHRAESTRPGVIPE